jgi:hypothetical protein
MSDVISRARLLEELGFGHPDAQSRALEALVAAGLTARNKENIAEVKRERCAAVLAERFARLCDRCAPTRGDGRERVPLLSPSDCEACKGSSNRAAVERATDKLRRAGKRRVVVVGGSPGIRESLRALWPPDLELRLVDGTERHTAKEARGHLAWCDLAVVWASTELNHKVSAHYTSAGGGKVLVVPRRGIEALAEAISARL